MRILYLGHLKPGQTSLMRFNALRRHDVDVVGLDAREVLDKQGWLERHVQSRFTTSTAIRRLNERLLQVANETRPDVVWLDKQELIEPRTLEKLKRDGSLLVYYTPDPYFAVPWKQTRFTKASMELFDVYVTAKSYELEDYRKLGGQVIYMPLGYCDQVHRPTSDVPSDQMIDVGFVGGWEPRREQFIEALAAGGRSVFIWGYGWEHLVDGRWTLRRRMRLARLTPEGRPRIRKSEYLASRIYPGEIYDADYAYAISRSALSLGFLRTIYPDQHTTRTFEIPACGSLLLADRTEEHQEFFEEGKEADYFSSLHELIEKATFYAKRPDVARKIARAGRERCERDRYSYFDRFGVVLSELGK